MAKKNRETNERRAVAERLRREQERKERRRTFVIVGAAVLVVIGLLTAALIPYLKEMRERNIPLSEIGASASAAGCGDAATKPASGNQDHVDPGTKIPYPDAPPAFGKHWGNFLTGGEIRTFYTVDDRPQVERLVHSLEHGYSIVWYDDTVKPGTKAYADLERLGKRLDTGDKVMAAPWTSEDGKPFPSGKHVALTHWTGPDDQQGVTQYCAKPSGGAVESFTKKYPKNDAPEPGGV